MSLARYLQIMRLVEGATTLSLTAAPLAVAPQDARAPTPLRDPATERETTEVLATLTRTLEQLPVQERLVLTLYYYEELTYREIGDILHVTEGRIRQLQATAVTRLRQALAMEG